jgi:hypothetical protein
MGIRDRIRKMGVGTTELEDERLANRYAGLGATTIAEAPLRERTRLGGEITSIRVVPRAGSPSLEVTVNDGSGTLAIAVFTGRRSIPGITPSRGIVLDGVARKERRRILLLNPAYELR